MSTAMLLAQIGVENPVERILMRQHVVEGLDVNDDLDKKKNTEAENPGSDRLDQRTRSRMKRREWHALLYSIPLFAVK